jgi:hypothetical protein
MKSFKSLSEEHDFLSEIMLDHLPRVLVQMTTEYLSVREIPLREWSVKDARIRDYAPGIAVFNDRIYSLTCPTNIKIHDMKGELLDEWNLWDEKHGYLGEVCDIAVFQDRIFIIDSLNHCIKVLSLEGKLLQQWEVAKDPSRKQEDEKDQLSAPLSLTIANNKLYIIDSGFDEVLAYSLQGELLQRWNFPGRSLSGMAVSPDGKRLYLTDVDDHYVLGYDLENSKILWQLGSYDEDPFAYPHVIVLSPQGEIYVADPNNNRVRILSQDGHFIRDWSYEKEGRKMGLDAIALVHRGKRDIEFYVIDVSNSMIYVFRQTYF